MSSHLAEQEKDNKDLAPDAQVSEEVEDSQEAALKKVIRKVSPYSEQRARQGRLTNGDRSMPGLYPLWPSCTSSRATSCSIVDLVSRYLFSYLDRSALANASIFGFRTDLSLSSVQYNLISTVSDLTRYTPLNSLYRSADVPDLLHCVSYLNSDLSPH